MNRLVIQLPIGADTDFDWLLHVEETLTRAFGLDDQADVDGHDMGEGRFNILVRASGPFDAVMARIRTLLQGLGALESARVARFDAATETYQLVHPASYEGEFQL